MRITCRCLALAPCLLALLVGAAGAQPLIQVPGDLATLQQALDRARTQGGTIELAPGTYAAPGNGFRLRNPQAKITVRAGAGGAVVLDGQGDRTIFELVSTTNDLEHRVFFEGLQFRNGFSDREQIGGAVSVVGAAASFVACRFEDSRSQASTTGGGGVVVAAGADVVFIDSQWINNTAQNRGGAVTVENSTAEIHGGRFQGNRTNLEGHLATAPGGAVYVLDSQVRIVGSSFEGNETGWVGGALYVFGTWSEPLAKPAAEVQVFDSTFSNNRAANHPCCVPPGVTAGGAIHVEDHATLRLYRSELIGNSAESGGAVDSYRGVVEIFDSVLRENFTAPQNRPSTFGGALFLVSSDQADASTDFGAVNRRPASLLLEGTLVQGRAGSAGPDSQNGGCLASIGDVNRRFGTGGVAQDGSAEDNRARITVRRSAFVGCQVEGLGQPADGFGGALNLRLTDLLLAESMILDSRCTTDNCGGGGISAAEGSRVRLLRSAMAGNAAHRGGALFLGGSEVEASDSLFSDNLILTPGGTSDIRESRGAAIFAIPGFSATQPDRETDVSGVVEGCTFADNRGIPIFDVDVDTGPHNTVRYDDNRFGPTGFGTRVYVNRLVRASGESAGELNALVVRRGDGTTTDKSLGGNVLLGASPNEGQLLATPPQLSPQRPDGGGNAHLAFAWSGSGARLGGESLATRRGLRQVSSPGRSELRSSSGSLLAAVDLTPSLCSIGPLLCLNEDRFKLGVQWETPRNEFGPGLSVPLTSDTGYFFFFNQSNVEMVVKLLRGCGINQHFWAFAGGLTNVRTEMRVVDSLTGAVQVYDNPQRTPFEPLQDTTAFATCNTGMQFDPDTVTGLEPSLAVPPLTLNEDRFEVTVRFRTPQGVSGEGQPVKLTSDTGYYFFFNQNNVEMVIKVLRGCGINGHYWVFAGGLTNVEVEITVTDTQTGTPKTYTNRLGTPFRPIQDVTAFAACP